MKLSSMALNDGAGPNARVLIAAAVEQMWMNGLPEGMGSGGWKTSIPSVANDGKFDPGVPKTWAYTFQPNEETAATGTPAGSPMWTGLGNLSSWIDRTHGVAGLRGSQSLPFQDVASCPAVVSFETVIYRHLTRRR